MTAAASVLQSNISSLQFDNSHPRLHPSWSWRRYSTLVHLRLSHLNWKKSKNSAGTQRILLDLLYNLVIRSRGVFSDFPYPPYIVEMLLDLVGKMVKGHMGLKRHINEVIEELEDEDLRNRMDNSLRDKALDAIVPPDITPP